MGMSGGTDDGQPMMEMNTTPLIDVLLVLLIMFIITIPIQSHAIKIDLPVDSPDPVEPPPVDPIKNRLGIDRSNQLLWNDEKITLKTLEGLLAETRDIQPEPELQFQPDEVAGFLKVDQALEKIKRSGVTKFGFVGNENYGSFNKAKRSPN